MKNLCFLPVIIFLLLALSGMNAQTGWYQQVSGTEQGLFGIHFADVDNGAIVGTSGTILRTTNGGNTWVQQISGTDFVLFDVSLIDANNGYAVGIAGTILKTTDGGKTWVSQTSGVTTALFSVFFTDVNNGTAVGHFGTILRTADGGTTWVQQTGGTTAGLESVFFIDISNGYIAGDNGTVLRTTNAGNNWTSLPTGIQINLNGVSFTDLNTGTVVGGSNLTGAKIFRTNDGGLSWMLQHSILTEVLTSVYFTDFQTGTAVGWNGTIFRTLDGGATWVSQNSNSASFFSSVFFINSDIGFAVGSSGTILATMDGGIPVELISFTASVSGTDVQLNWSTASEINNSGFEIERKNPPLNPLRGGENSSWGKVGFVEGNGTTTETKAYSFKDNNVSAGKYSYRLKQIDYDGTFEYSGIVDVEVTIPGRFALEQNYPNPFNPSTVISFQLAVAGRVTLRIFNVVGEEVAALINNKEFASGLNNVNFNAEGLNSGVYFYKIQAGSFTQVKKMMLLR